MLLTGGGPPKKPCLDPVLQVVEDAAPSLDVSVICSWDNTASFEKDEAVKSLTATEEAVSEPPTVDPDVSTLQLPSASTVHSENALPGVSVITPISKRVVTEKKARVNKVLDAAQQQQEIFEIKKQILTQDLLWATERRKQKEKLMKLRVEAAEGQ
ncbi:hypothetical protein RN001_002856 [Aquatica leii]|uniref:Uncharacterized protein n=1 Tax=Aquatica leii TaxID=1421715 RepID=A0AAN7PE39_9COLE|nr:hypothetical protein RN001_002856 [Aquatica leii]